MSQLQRIRLYLSGPQVCGYLAGRSARNAYVDPDYALNAERYGHLLEQGFRRSGAYTYRPHCQACRRCIPARVPVAHFTPNRAQRRCLKTNSDVSLQSHSQLNEEHYRLYRRYLHARHPGGGMDADNVEAFHQFLQCPWGQTEFWEFRSRGRLLSVAVVDRLPRALSAVYTFFDPAESARSLGVLAVLKQLEQAKSAGLAHLYLGYWVPGSSKMDYKQNYQPLELLGPNGWQREPAAVAAQRVNADNAPAFIT